MKILVIRLSSLGDVILTQSVCAYLRAQYPDAEIHYITKSAYIEIVQLMGLNLKPISYSQSLSAHWELYKGHYDLVLDLHAKLSSRLISFATCAPHRAVYHKQRRIRRQIVSGNKSLSIRSTLDLYQSALEPFFNIDSLAAPSLNAPNTPLKLILPVAKRLICIFPGAQHYTKMYPTEYYKELLRLSPPDYYYILVGSPGEYELCDSIKQAAPDRAMNIAGELSFGELLVLLQRMDLVISSDSGPMHLAAAIQKPQIAIFGATHPRLGFAPLNPHATILSLDLECSPCTLHGSARCPLGHFDCMQRLTPMLLLQKIKANLA